MKRGDESGAGAGRARRRAAKGANPWLTWFVVAGVLAAAVLVGTLRLRSRAAEEAAAASASASASAARFPSDDPPVSGAALALLGGLKTGDDVAGWKVRSITRSSDAQMKEAIAVWLEKDKKSFVVWIASKGRLSFHPAIETKGFGVFFGAFNPALADPDAGDSDAQPAVDAIGARVRDNEDKTSAAGLL